MMVDSERSGGAGSGAARRDPDQIMKESRALLAQLMAGFDELEKVITETREDAQRQRGSGRWGR